jgi:hypothetical protein
MDANTIIEKVLLKKWTSWMKMNLMNQQLTIWMKITACDFGS